MVKLFKVKGIDFSVITNQRRNRITNIDDIVWPSWDLLPIENYLGNFVKHLLKIF